jgi:hypothetical protein
VYIYDPGQPYLLDICLDRVVDEVNQVFVLFFFHSVDQAYNAKGTTNYICPGTSTQFAVGRPLSLSKQFPVGN